MLNNYKCQNIRHNQQQIQGTCENLYCKQERKVCLSCQKLHENDYDFKLSDIKSSTELEQEIEEFKQGSVSEFNNIILQCDSQQYILNLKLIELVKLWNYKSDKLNQIKQNAFNFIQNDWNNISITDYLSNQDFSKGIQQYLRTFQLKLLDIDKQKNHYLKYIVNENNYEHTNYIKAAQEVIDVLQKNQDQVFQYIEEDPLFQLQQQNENTLIAISETILREGYNLQSDIQYQQFQQIKNHILKDIDKDKMTYIQVYSLISKQKNEPQELEKAIIKIKSLIIKYPLIPKYHYLQGKLYFLLGNHKSAHDSYSTAINLDSQSSNYYYEIGVNYEKLNIFDRAIQMYDYSLQLNPNHFQSLFNKAIILQNNQDFKGELLILNKAIQIKPNFIKLYIRKCEIMMNFLKKYEFAYDIINQAIEIDTTNSNCFLLRGQLETHFKRHEQAIKNFNQAIEINPDNYQGYFYIGEIMFLHMQQYEQALQMFDQSLVRNDQHIQSYLYKVKILYWFQNNYQQAIIFCDKIIKLDNKNIEALEIKGEMLKQYLFQSTQALEVYDQLIKMDPTKNLYYINKAEILQFKSHNNEAVKVYDVLISMAPRNIDMYETKAQILSNKLNKHEEALQVYNQYLGIDKNNFNFNFNKAKILFDKLNQFKDALEAFDICINFNPNHFDANYYKAEILFKKQNQYSNAVVAYDKCIKLNPNHYESMYSKALLQEKLNNYQDAIKTYDQCIRINNQKWQSYDNKAKILQHQQKHNLAVEVYQAYISVVPNHFDSFYSIADIYHTQRLTDKAIKFYDICINLDPSNYKSYNAKAKILLEQQKYSELLAIQVYDKYLKNNPAYYDCYFQKALIYYEKLQDSKKALPILQQCIEIDPNKYEAYKIQGKILLYTQREYQKAILCFKKALELNELDFESKELLDKCQGKTQFSNSVNPLQRKVQPFNQGLFRQFTSPQKHLNYKN